MRFIKNISIKMQLLLAFLTISLIPLAVIGIVAMNRSSNALTNFAFGQLESLREVKKDRILNFLDERESDTHVLLDTVSTLRQAAFDKLRTVQENKKAAVEAYFQKCIGDIQVLSENPLVLDALGAFEETIDENGIIDEDLYGFYDDLKYGDALTRFKEHYGYDDLLLISETGRVLYSLNKEADRAQDLTTPEWEQTGLGQAFQAGMNDEVVLIDFAPYPPADNRYIGFVAAPLHKQGQIKGVVVLKLHTAPLNAIVQRRKGMGKSGETYLVGQKEDVIRYRSDRVVIAGAFGDIKAGSDVEQALAGESDTIVKIGSTGTVDIFSYDPLDIPGLQWAILTTMSLEEAIAPKLEGEDADYFVKYISQYNYEDLYLIHPQGHVFYSVNHDAAYGTNLLTGEYAESGVGNIFQETITSKTFSFADYQPYPPSQGQLSAFLAQPLITDESIELVVALRLSSDALNRVMQERSGMGKTGETYLVGSDMLMRSDSHLDPEHYSAHASFANPVERRIETHATQQALAGMTGESIITNYTGTEVLSAYTPLDVWGTTWGLIAEMSTSEALSSVHSLRQDMLLIALLALLAIVLLISFIIRSFAAQLSKVIAVFDRVANGDLSQNFHIESTNEFGQLLSSMKQMIQKISSVLTETDRLTLAVQEGKLDVRGDTKKFSGGWRDLVKGINNTIDAFVLPINMTSTYIEQLSEDRIPEPIQEHYQGDFNNIKTNLNLLGDKTRDVLQETARIVKAVQEGKLTVRGDASRFGGGWKELIEGLNQLMEAFVTPIQMTAAYVDRISVGDIPEVVTDGYQGDFNAIIQSLNRLIHNVRDVAHVAETMANGDLTIDVHERSEQDALMHALQRMLTTLNKTVREVKTAAERLTERSREMNVISEKMSQGATEQAAAAEEVSSSMEQMAANIHQNADNAKMTEAIALQSAEDARQGEDAVMNIIEAMETIAERIMSVQDIANQTNILSLNATIEAAKAQEYGRGFAVVATSVRDLAQRSRNAADEINLLVRSCAKLTEKAGEVLRRLVPNSEKTAELVQDISAASQEQTSGTEQINRAIQQLDSVTQHNATTAEQLSATAEALASRAEKLQDATQFFQVKAEKELELVEQREEEEFARLLKSFFHASEQDKRRITDILKTVQPYQEDSEDKEATIDNSPKEKEAPPPEVSDQSKGVDIQFGEDGNTGKDLRDKDFEPY